jgi:hypothetical protein
VRDAEGWEVRLQDEIRSAFTIDEAGSDEHRARLLAHHAADARAIEAAEDKRRERKAARAGAEEPEAAGEGEGDAGEGAEDEG